MHGRNRSKARVRVCYRSIARGLKCFFCSRHAFKAVTQRLASHELDPIKNEDHLISHHIHKENAPDPSVLHEFLFQPRSTPTLRAKTLHSAAISELLPPTSSLCHAEVGLDRRRRLGIDTLRHSDHPENQKGMRRGDTVRAEARKW